MLTRQRNTRMIPELLLLLSGVVGDLLRPHQDRTLVVLCILAEFGF